MLILADLGHDPKHWPSEAATAADQSDDRGALLAYGSHDSGRQIEGVWGGGARIVDKSTWEVFSFTFPSKILMHLQYVIIVVRAAFLSKKMIG